MTVARRATIVSAAGIAALAATIMTALSFPEEASFVLGLLALCIAGVGWLVALGATIVRPSWRRMVAVVLLPIALVGVVAASDYLHRVSPWLEFLLRERRLSTLADHARRTSQEAITATELRAANARAIELQPGYVAVLHRHSGSMLQTGFLRPESASSLPSLGGQVFGQRVVALRPLHHGWYVFETQYMD